MHGIKILRKQKRILKEMKFIFSSKSSEWITLKHLLPDLSFYGCGLCHDDFYILDRDFVLVSEDFFQKNLRSG